ncbi:MAG: TIR domain-containing protein [Anaerolineae bacterium]|nr:TIR domain-containing protein [Anaerolineae bacterium]
MQAQQWSALAFIKNERSTVAQEITTAIETASNQQPGGIPSNPELKRLAALAEQLAPELEGYPEIIEQAKRARDLLSGKRLPPSPLPLGTTHEKTIFIAYSRKDGKTFATQLRQRLESEGLSSWQDRDRMEGGVGWWQQITEALGTVEFMVLVATPAALKSPVATKEWRYARQQGVCVYPVLVPGLPPDFGTLPRWMQDSHFYNLDEEWENFVHYLKNPCQAVRVPFMAPDLPAHLVEQPERLDAIKSQLLKADKVNPVAITTALRGAGGFGKTTLATALCHDEDIQAAFDDGILWVTLGEQPDLLHEITLLYKALTGENPVFLDVNEATRQFAEKLGDNDCLIVIDDVWNAAHLKPFLQGGKRCARLITTRFVDITVEVNAVTPVEVDEMTSDIPDGVISLRQSAVEPAPEISEAQRLEVLSRVTMALATPNDSLEGRLLDVIRPYFPALHSGGISLIHDKELFHVAYYPPGRAEISNRLARRALDERVAFRWDRTAASDTSGYFSSLTGTTQALYAPILRGANNLGVIYLHTRGTFSQADLSLLSAISEIVGANANFDPQTARLRLPSVFISYSYKDTDFVKDLVADIRRQRVTVWFDERLRSGKDWQGQLTQAIRQSDAFALVLSPDSLVSKYVRWEIEQAHEAGKPIFAMLHRPCDSVPDDLARLQWIDLLADYRAGVLELVEELYAQSSERDTLKSEPVIVPRAGSNEKTRILFLAANPSHTNPLRLGEEIRTILERIRGSRYRDQLDTKQGWAVRYSDLQQYLLEYAPHIVHFSGHGGENGAIMLENERGESQPVNKKTLQLLFRAFKEKGVRLVVLNACFSAVQAEVIAEEVGCVVGMTRAVGDRATVAFAGAFYNALTFGRSVQAAFNLGAGAMSLTGEEEMPKLLTHNIDASRLFFFREDEI